MLTSANVTSKMAANYYEADNYYTTGEVLSPAVWTGQFANELGLDGKTDPKLFAQNFEQMLRGFGPDGKPLIKNPEYPYPQSIVGAPVSIDKKDQEPRRAALDLTFSAPKSVSLQALVFGDIRLVAAHRAAVKETLQYLEVHFAQCRVGPKAERRVLVTEKLAVAQFEHDLSREKNREHLSKISRSDQCEYDKIQSQCFVFYESEYAKLVCFKLWCD